MKKFVPYVNLETVKDSDGKIERFNVSTVTYLPEDSKISTSGEGKVSDSTQYRKLTISYTGTSAEFDYFGADFAIERKDVGLLERGVKVVVKSAGTAPMAMSELSGEIKDPTGDTGGTTVEYEDEDLP